MSAYPMPVSTQLMPDFSKTTPELVHHSLNALKGALVWCGSSSCAREGYLCAEGTGGEWGR